MVRRDRRPARHPRRHRTAPGVSGDHRRPYRRGGRLGAGVVGLCHRCRGPPYAVPGPGRRVRRARCRCQRGRHHPPVVLRTGHRGRFRRASLGPPRWLPQRARCRPSSHGRGGIRTDPRRDVRVGMASSRRRRVQLRQAGGGGPHLAPGPTRARQGSRSMPSLPSPAPEWSPRRSSAPARRAGPVAAADSRSIRCQDPKTSARWGPTWSASEPAGARAKCCSPVVPRWRWSDQPRLIEVVRTTDAVSLEAVLQAVIPRAFLPAESGQATAGGSNPRFGAIFGESAPAATTSAESSPASSSATGPSSRRPSPTRSRPAPSPVTASNGSRTGEIL